MFHLLLYIQVLCKGGSTETFQTVSSCLTEHWDGDMKKLNEAKFGCDEEKTAPVKAVAEPNFASFNFFISPSQCSVKQLDTV
jgi:hypothetical protein